MLFSNHDETFNLISKKFTELNITFNAGRRYTYYGVEHKDYVRFEIAESQGQIFNKHIKKYMTKKNEDIDPNPLLEKVSNLITN